NTVEGNFIGTDVTGTRPLGNGDGLFTAGSDTIGGTTPGAGNVISGNFQEGIDNFGGRPPVLGNLIGTDAAGPKPLGNAGDGLCITAASSLTIAGTAPGAGNVISGNPGRGLGLGTELPTDVEIERNLIGTDASGAAPLGNGVDGIGGTFN